MRPRVHDNIYIFEEKTRTNKSLLNIICSFVRKVLKELPGVTEPNGEGAIPRRGSQLPRALSLPSDSSRSPRVLRGDARRARSAAPLPAVISQNDFTSYKCNNVTTQLHLLFPLAYTSPTTSTFLIYSMYFVCILRVQNYSKP